MNRTFGEDNLQEKNRMMEQQLVESREKGNFLHMKNQVSFSLGKFAPSELCPSRMMKKKLGESIVISYEIIIIRSKATVGMSHFQIGEWNDEER